jgi:hypothetical protein
MKKDFDEIRQRAKALADEVRVSTRPAVEAARSTATTTRENLGLSDPITTETVVAIIGSTATVVTADNIASVRGHAHPFTDEVQAGDVVWTVEDPARLGTHLCGVRVAQKAGVIREAKSAEGLMSRAGRDEHEGSLSIVNGHLILHSGGKRFDMRTCRELP